MARLRIRKPKECPFCLAYTREFNICIECGKKVCTKSCSIDHGSVSFCCECFTISKRTRKLMKETIDQGEFLT